MGYKMASPSALNAVNIPQRGPWRGASRRLGCLPLLDEQRGRKTSRKPHSAPTRRTGLLGERTRETKRAQKATKQAHVPSHWFDSSAITASRRIQSWETEHREAFTTNRVACLH